MADAAKPNPLFVPATALIHALQRLRDVHPDMTLFQTQFLLAVAANPGATQREVYDLLGSNDSVASRTLSLLGEYGSRSVAGLELIEFKPDPNDRRVRRLNLTPKGRRIVNGIFEDML